MPRARPQSDYDIDQLGERALRETKEERDLHQRLKDIEYELNHISEKYQPEVSLLSTIAQHVNMPYFTQLIILFCNSKT